MLPPSGQNQAVGNHAGTPKTQPSAAHAPGSLGPGRRSLDTNAKKVRWAWLLRFPMHGASPPKIVDAGEPPLVTKRFCSVTASGGSTAVSMMPAHGLRGPTPSFLWCGYHRRLHLCGFSGRSEEARWLCPSWPFGAHTEAYPLRNRTTKTCTD